MLSLTVLTIYPILNTFYLSFTEYSIIQDPQWVGFDNYIDIFENDPSVRVAVVNSFYYAFLSVPIGLVASFILALILNMRATGIGIYRTLFYLPTLVPPVAATITFTVMLEPRSGVVNSIINGMGFTGPAWLNDPSWSKPALIIISMWGHRLYDTNFSSRATRYSNSFDRSG